MFYLRVTQENIMESSINSLATSEFRVFIVINPTIINIEFIKHEIAGIKFYMTVKDDRSYNTPEKYLKTCLMRELPESLRDYLRFVISKTNN